MAVANVPLILVCQIMRFDNQLRKISTPFLLDSTTIVESDEGDFQYQLFGVVVHIGNSTNAGHYYAYTKDETNKWWKCDDQSVQLTTFEHIQT